MIDGLKAVPKAERHQLRELSVEEAYEDWKLEPLRRRLEESKAQYERSLRQKEEAAGRWENSSAFWTIFGAEEEKILYNELCKTEQYVQECQEIWHQACLEWYDALMELEDSFVD